MLFDSVLIFTLQKHLWWISTLSTKQLLCQGSLVQERYWNKLAWMLSLIVVLRFERGFLNSGAGGKAVERKMGLLRACWEIQFAVGNTVPNH